MIGNWDGWVGDGIGRHCLDFRVEALVVAS